MSSGDELAEELLYIKEVAQLRIKDGTFGRSEVLDQLKNKAKEYEARPNDSAKIHELYKIWYKLPRALRDYDAFIVKNVQKSHNEIAQISTKIT